MARTNNTGRSLLESLQWIIERTYDLETGVRDIGRFVIGDEGYRRVYGSLEAAGMIANTMVGEGARRHCDMTASTRARTLLRQFESGLALCVYYPDRLIERLERQDPTRRLDAGNVDDFSVLVEELDHFLVIADRYRSHGLMSLLDLELHANVTKYLVLQMFVGKMHRTPRLSAADAAWIRFHLFDKSEFAEPDPAVNARYRDASRFAARYAGRLDALSPSQRLSELRRFHRMTPQAKISHIHADS